MERAPGLRFHSQPCVSPSLFEMEAPVIIPVQSGHRDHESLSENSEPLLDASETNRYSLVWPGDGPYNSRRPLSDEDAAIGGLDQHQRALNVRSHAD